MIQESTSLTYEPASEPLNIVVKWLSPSKKKRRGVAVLVLECAKHVWNCRFFSETLKYFPVLKLFHNGRHSRVKKGDWDGVESTLVIARAEVPHFKYSYAKVYSMIYDSG